MTDDSTPAGGGLTPADRQRLVERHVEVMTHRKVEEDLRLARTIEVGQLLNRLKGG